MSSNLHLSGFDEIIPKTLAGATVDRLLHHAHLCATVGGSIRLASNRRQDLTANIGNSRGRNRGDLSGP